MAASSRLPAAVSQRSFPLCPREVGLAGIVTLLGIALRWGALSQVTLAHFDEGIYASNVWFGSESDYAYPARHLYAPPLVPALIELSISLGGATGSAPLLPGLICGCLLVPLVWWVGRQWFGPAAGLIAGTLAALSGPHAYFSRTALTDAPLCLFLTAAVYLGGEWIQRGGSRRWLAAATCAALSWWTKYNGWLPLAIWSSAVVPWLLFRLGGMVAWGAVKHVSRETAGVLDGSARRAGRGDSVVGQVPEGGNPQEKSSNLAQPGWGVVLKPVSQTIVATGVAPVSRETNSEVPPVRGVSRETVSLGGTDSPRAQSVSRETGPKTPAGDATSPLGNTDKAPHPGNLAFLRSQLADPAPVSSSAPLTFQSEGSVPTGMPDSVSRGTAQPSTPAAAPTTGSDPTTAGDGCGQPAPKGTEGLRNAGIAVALPSIQDALGWKGEPTVACTSQTPSPAINLARVSRETTATPPTCSSGPASRECELAPAAAAQSHKEFPHEEKSIQPTPIAPPGNGVGLESADSAGSRISEASSSRAAAEVPPSRFTRLGPGFVSHETSKSPAVGRVVGRVFLLLTLAIGLWLPCLWGLESLGGYRVVAANHRRYLVGWSGMMSSVVRQFEALMFLEDFPSRFAWLLGLSLLWINSPRRTVPVWGWSILAAGGLCFGTLPITFLVAIALLVCLVRPAGRSRWGELPIWLLLSWWLSLTLATPGYTPYPRLTLPWLVASWLAAGAWVAGWLVSETESQKPTRADSRPGPGRWGALGLLLLGAVASSRAWQRDWLIGHQQMGLAEGARQVVEAIQQSLEISHKQPIDALIYVHAEPALVFHLRARGLPVVRPVQDLEFTRKPGVDRAPTFIILGDRSQREPGFEGPPAGDARWRPVAQLELAVPPLVWLDEAWQSVADGALDRPYHLEVWRVGSAPNP